MSINNIIVMNRGDTYKFDLTIRDESFKDNRYILQGNDTIYLGIMDPGQPFEEALVRKKYTKDDLDALGNLFVVLQPEDTLDLLPGKYFYSVKLRIDHEELDSISGKPTGRYIKEVRTVINKTKFIICD